MLITFAVVSVVNDSSSQSNTIHMDCKKLEDKQSCVYIIVKYPFDVVVVVSCGVDLITYHKIQHTHN